MQFQNAVITPSGIAIFSAANANKPIKFTRFLFTDSTTRLTGQETELPANTWGNGSVDAVVGQDELQQFVIYASASNADDYGYARGYGIYAVQDNVEYLVAVANCLGEPTYVSQRSGGYTRFHLALTIKYNVNSSVLTVEPNMAGLISRAEFESWTERVVTTHSPSGAPYGEDQTIYGQKYFRNNTQFGVFSDRVALNIFGDIGMGGQILPLTGVPNATLQIGSDQFRWPDIYCTNLHADYVSTKAVMLLNGTAFDGITQSGMSVGIQLSSVVSRHRGFKLSPNDSNIVGGITCMNMYTDTVYGQRRRGLKKIDFYFYFDATTPYVTELQTRGRLILTGKSAKNDSYITQTFEASMKSLRGTVTDNVMRCVLPDWESVGDDGDICALGHIDYIYVELELIR